MANQAKRVNKGTLQGLTRIQFYTLVQNHMNQYALSQPAAYELVEVAHNRKYGMRKYVNYDSYRYVNYRSQLRETQCKMINSEILNAVYDLANRHKDGDLSTPDFVNELKPYIMR
jgi:PIN domain nuclease of toxin-antitoxin system